MLNMMLRCNGHLLSHCRLVGGRAVFSHLISVLTPPNCSSLHFFKVVSNHYLMSSPILFLIFSIPTDYPLLSTHTILLLLSAYVFLVSSTHSVPLSAGGPYFPHFSLLSCMQTFSPASQRQHRPSVIPLVLDSRVFIWSDTVSEAVAKPQQPTS